MIQETMEAHQWPEIHTIYVNPLYINGFLYLAWYYDAWL